MLPRPVTPPCFAIRRKGLVEPPPPLCAIRDVTIIKPIDCSPSVDIHTAASRYFSEYCSDTHDLESSLSSALVEEGTNTTIFSHTNTQPFLSLDDQQVSVVSLQPNESRHMDTYYNQGTLPIRDEVVGNSPVQDREFRKISEISAPHAMQNDLASGKLDFHRRTKIRVETAFILEEINASDSVREPKMKASI